MGGISSETAGPIWIKLGHGDEGSLPEHVTGFPAISVGPDGKDLSGKIWSVG